MTIGPRALGPRGHRETLGATAAPRSPSSEHLSERFAQIDPRATAVAGLVVLVTMIVDWLVAIARGQSGHPYDWLLALSGLSYLLAVVLFRWRG